MFRMLPRHSAEEMALKNTSNSPVDIVWNIYLKWMGWTKMQKLSDYLKTGYIVEIDDEKEQICIIPSGGGIPTDHFLAVTKMVGEMGCEDSLA